MRDSSRPASTLDRLVALCSAVFIVMLALAAYWDPKIRVLHVFEAAPYLAAAALCLRRIKFGYMLGIAGGLFWLWTAGSLTTFVRNGLERLSLLLRTGHLERPDILLAVPAAIATAGLVLFSVLGYVRLPKKSWTDAGLFLAAFGFVAVFFVAIFAAFAPQYLGMFRTFFGK